MSSSIIWPWYADVVLDNSGSLEHTLAHVQAELDKLLGDKSGC